MITEWFVSGMRNQQHQSRILSKAATLLTFAANIERLQCQGSTKQPTNL